MLIRKVSSYSKVEHTIDINVTPEQIADWKCGTLIQRAMPNVSAEHREFIKSGITPEEWEDMMKGLDDEDDEDPDKRYHR